MSGAVGIQTPVSQAELLAAARQRPDLAWKPDADIASAVNAHRTNTPHEMHSALLSDVGYTFLESDLRRAPDTSGLVMAHGKRDIPQGLAFQDWLDVGKASGRGLKIDIKERAAIGPMIEVLRGANVPPHQLLINVSATGRVQTRATVEQLRELRALNPEGVINLSPADYRRLTPRVIDDLVAAAKEVGGSVMFPLQWDLLTDGIIQRLSPHGRVAVWTLPQLGSPRSAADAALEAVRLRSRGVTGMIDLEVATPGQMKLQPLMRAIRKVIGQHNLNTLGEKVLRGMTNYV